VDPAYRCRGITADLLASLAAEARQAGYQRVYGDTLPTMLRTLGMYRRMGFVEVGQYSDNPTPGAVYLRRAVMLNPPNSTR
jgi:putative acetyltransferase